MSGVTGFIKGVYYDPFKWYVLSLLFVDLHTQILYIVARE